MKKLLFALALLASPALAGPKPADVAEYDEQPVSYPSGYVTAPTLGDGSNSHGGTPPAFATMPDDIPTPARTTYLETGASYCGGGVGAATRCGAPGWREAQPKFRLSIPAFKMLCDDPVRNYSQPGQSHCHQWYGNKGANAYSTYNSLRTRSDSTSTPLNATAYWFPPLCKANTFGDGKTYCVRSDWITVYYAADTQADIAQLVRIPRGLRYVAGTHMDDPDDDYATAEIAAANAQSGTAGRYAYVGNGFIGWQCVNNGVVINVDNDIGGANVYPALTKPDGTSDPWGGRCKGKSEPGISDGQLIANIHAQQCWDGVNLWSTDGYKHMRNAVSDTTNGHLVCPNGWYKIPKLELKFFFTFHTTGEWTGYRLTSDDMAATAAGHAMLNGSSFHADWFGGWDDETFTTWQEFCLGVGQAEAFECNDNTIDATHRLPSISFTQYGTSSANVMFKLPTQHQGPATVHTHRSANELDDDETVVCLEGDSITIAGGSTGMYGPYFAAQHPNVTTHVLGVGGSALNTLFGRRDDLLALNCDIVTVFVGTNDIGGETTAQAWVDRMLAYVAPIKARGSKVFVATPIPKYVAGNTSYTNNHNTLKAEIATLLREQAGHAFYGVIDFEADPIMGPAAAAQDTDLYSDGTHPTERGGGVGGHDYLYTIFNAAVEPVLE